MTPAEWLALAVLASVGYNVLEHLVDPDAVKTTINNNVAGLIRLAFGLTILVLAVVVALS